MAVVDASGVNERRVVQRRYAPKTRTGCVTCKIRRVKCDEARPSCKRCTSTGRTCDGYVNTTSVRKSPGVISICLSSESNYGPRERRTFEFFRARTGPCISGYYSDPVWDRFVLQISNSEPVVRHLIHAIGAVHEARLTAEKSKHDLVSFTPARSVVSHFAAVEYHQALTGLQDLLKRDSVHLDVVLMCALLMVHFEALRECFVSALTHVDNTITLLQSSATFDARKVDPGIVRSLIRLDLQGTYYLAMRAPRLPFFTSEVDDDLPSTFRDLTQARDVVNTWSCRLFHFLRTVADGHKYQFPGRVTLDVLAASHDLAKTFVNLDKLLWDFMHKSTTRLTIMEQHGLGMLRARNKVNRVTAAGCLYCEASVYDAFMSEFEDIMNICNWIIESDSAERRLFTVSLDEGIVPPLWFTATQCRDSRLRHKALEQLQALAREGAWHVGLLTRTAEVCVRIEEAQCAVEQPRCQDIPEWRRIHTAGFDGWVASKDKSEAVAHLRIRPNGMDGEWVDLSQKIGHEYTNPSDVTTIFDMATPFILMPNNKPTHLEEGIVNEEKKSIIITQNPA